MLSNSKICCDTTERPLGWYPGFGEEWVLTHLPGPMQNFLAEACAEYPPFLEGYLIPSFESPAPYDKILQDIDLALGAVELEDQGLGSYDEFLLDPIFRMVPEALAGLQETINPPALGDLRVVAKQKDFNKERKAITTPAKREYQQAQREYSAARKSKDAEQIAREKAELAQERAEYDAARKTFQKAKLTKDERKAITSEIGRAKQGTHWAFFKDARTGDVVATQAKTKKSGNFFSKMGRVANRYGDIAIGAAGIVLAPFTGGASLVAASLLTAAHGMYKKKRAAEQAKHAAGANAQAIKDDAARSEREVAAQVDKFYRDNQAWFLQRGITPAKWAAMSLQQKIDAINAGTQAPGAGGSGAPSGGGSSSPGSWGGGSLPGGGGGGGGMDAGGGGFPGMPGAPGSAPGAAPQVAQSSMFGSDMLLPAIALALGVAIFGKSAGGKKSKRRSRPRRNPRRRSAWRRW